MGEKTLSVLEQNKDEIYYKFLLPLENNKFLERRQHKEKDKRKRLDGEFQRDFTRVYYTHQHSEDYKGKCSFLQYNRINLLETDLLIV